jgi:hypothetical protein
MITQMNDVDFWISPVAAAKLVGVSLNTLKAKAARWRVRVRSLPYTRGHHYHLDDLRRVVDEAEAKARAVIEAAHASN